VRTGHGQPKDSGAARSAARTRGAWPGGARLLIKLEACSAIQIMRGLAGARTRSNLRTLTAFMPLTAGLWLRLHRY
jgi:hypothetical protein